MVATKTKRESVSHEERIKRQEAKLLPEEVKETDILAARYSREMLRLAFRKCTKPQNGLSKRQRDWCEMVAKHDPAVAKKLEADLIAEKAK